MGLFKQQQQQSSDDVVAPNDPQAMTSLGLRAEEAGDLDAARAWYEQAATRDRSDCTKKSDQTSVCSTQPAATSPFQFSKWSSQ